MTSVIGVLTTVGWILAVGGVILGLGILYHWVGRGIGAYFGLRGERLVTCPETHKPVGVEVDAVHAAATAFRRSPELRLTSCTRWPERAGCGQECLQQVEAAPHDCLVRNIITRWYAGKSCAYCGKAFEEIHWHDHKPALLGIDGRTLEWSQVSAESVPDSLAADKPVCWNCHVNETFRREHPELVVDRPWTGPDRHHRMM